MVLFEQPFGGSKVSFRKEAAIPPHESTSDSIYTLLRKAQGGDQRARDELCRRYLSNLNSLAHGKLPDGVRGAMDTDDVVQEAFLKVLRRLDGFDPQHDEALKAYLRVSVMNRVKDEYKRKRPELASEGEVENLTARVATPLEDVMGREMFDRYEAALGRLKDQEREMLVAKIELDLGYDQIARLFKKSTPDAARVAIRRALTRLAEEMSVKP